MSVKKHFETIAQNYDTYKHRNSYYYLHLKQLTSTLIPPRHKVLDFGCGTGDVLCYLKPSVGHGVDLSQNMVEIARSKHQHSRYLKFANSTRDLPSTRYDYVLMSDVIEHLENPLSSFSLLSQLMNPKTQLVCTMANPLWEPALQIAERLNLKMPEGPHNRLSLETIKNILKKAGLKIIHHDYALPIPIWIPVISEVINGLSLGKLSKYAFIEYFIAIKENH